MGTYKGPARPSSSSSGECLWDGAHKTTLHPHSQVNTRLHGSVMWRITNGQHWPASPTPSHSVQPREEVTSQCVQLEGPSLDSIPAQPLPPRTHSFPPLQELPPCKTAWCLSLTCRTPGRAIQCGSQLCLSSWTKTTSSNRKTSKGEKPNSCQKTNTLNPQPTDFYTLAKLSLAPDP